MSLFIRSFLTFWISQTISTPNSEPFWVLLSLSSASLLVSLYCHNNAIFHRCLRGVASYLRMHLSLQSLNNDSSIPPEVWLELSQDEDVTWRLGVEDRTAHFQIRRVPSQPSPGPESQTLLSRNKGYCWQPGSVGHVLLVACAVSLGIIDVRPDPQVERGLLIFTLTDGGSQTSCSHSDSEITDFNSWVSLRGFIKFYLI